VELRSYQHRMLEESRALLKQGVRRLLIVSPTGSGKTCLVATMIGNASRRGKRCFFNVHRQELLDQSSDTFRACEIPHSFIAANAFHDPRAPVQLASVQTLARRIERVRKPDLVVWDEAHHVAAKSWASVAAAYPDAIHVGLTATPQRLDGAGLADHFDAIVLGPTVQTLITDGFLAPYRYFEPSTIDTSGLHQRMGDFVTAEAEALVDKPTITGNAIAEYRRHCDGQQGVAFCVSIRHSQHVAAEFNAAGIAAAHIDGSMDRAERRACIEDFRQGRVRMLCNVDLISEGFDLPAMAAAILLRPTQSLALYLQQVGRALRPGKPWAFVLDHVGNRLRHGLPDDDREWSLEGRRKRQGATQAFPVRQCPACFATLRGGAAVCPCGHVFEAVPREVVQVAGELAEVDTAAVRKRPVYDQDRRGARSVEDLIAYGRTRGMKNPEGWARHVHEARMAKQRRA
jgi:DNA repair protein RadD